MVYYKNNDSMLLLETFVILEYNGIQQSRTQFDRVCSAILCKVDFLVSNTWGLLFIVVVHADSRTLLVQNFDYKLILYGFIDYCVCNSYQNFSKRAEGTVAVRELFPWFQGHLFATSAETSITDSNGGVIFLSIGSLFVTCVRNYAVLNPL